MRKHSFLTFLKEKSFIIVLALLLVSAGTMVALFQMGGAASKEQEQVAGQETSETKKPVVKPGETQQKPEGTKQTVPPQKAAAQTKTDTKEKKPQVQEEAKASMGAELEDQYMESAEMAEASAGDVIAEEFSQSDLLSLQWPVEGEVLLGYSMDHSIYFPTLAQYQYNPAMIIGAPEGTPVICAASGTVTDVGKSNEYGHYVTMDLGDGFELTYGQLFDVTTEVGEELETGEQFALVAYPTRSFSEEGDNLYLKLTKDGVSVNPELYLEE